MKLRENCEGSGQMKKIWKKLLAGILCSTLLLGQGAGLVYAEENVEENMEEHTEEESEENTEEYTEKTLQKIRKKLLRSGDK